jgi:hypothetical protein
MFFQKHYMLWWYFYCYTEADIASLNTIRNKNDKFHIENLSREDYCGGHKRLQKIKGEEFMGQLRAK